MESIVRPYTPSDRDAVRHICCETAFAGAPVDPLFRDREIFADFFTRYYTDWEPESCLVAVQEGQVVGYLLGCRRYRFHALIEKWILSQMIPKVIWRLLTGKYDAQSRAFLRWCCTKAARETPSKPKNAAHFHFNLMPGYRGIWVGLYLVNGFIDLVKQAGIPIIYGQIQTYDDRRPLKVFERYGFHEYERRAVTKFQAFHDRPVYVSTMVREVQ